MTLVSGEPLPDLSVSALASRVHSILSPAPRIVTKSHLPKSTSKVFLRMGLEIKSPEMEKLDQRLGCHSTLLIEH